MRRFVVAGLLACVGLLAFEWLMPALAMADGSHGGQPVHTFKNSPPVAFMFWFFALATLGGAIFVITRRNMVTAVMGMVGTFFAIAGLYLMLYASFLAVIQVLVYAGAIMVLFVFVIMILNRPEAEPWAMEGKADKVEKLLALGGLGYFTYRLASVLWEVRETHDLIADSASSERLSRPVSEVVATATNAAPDAVYTFGSVRGVGHTLFTEYLFAFEAVSLVLLVAVVGAVAIARPTPQTAPAKGAEEQKEEQHD
jgi:NADH-quinone oxidoreductase subunit J